MKNQGDIKKLSDFTDKKVIIYGAGSTGHDVLRMLSKNNPEAKVFAFSDTYKSGVDAPTGLEVLSQNSLENHKDAVIIIGLSDYHKIAEAGLIESQLKDMGFKVEQIVRYAQFVKLFETVSAEQFEWKRNDDNYDCNANALMIDRMSEWITKGDRSVADLGAGGMGLKKLISPGTKYYPVDYKARYPETIVCDFNKDEFPDIEADVYFLCAMLYYIEEPIRFLQKVGSFAKRKILIGLHSINLAEHKELVHVFGHKNHIYVEEIRDCLSKYGFSLKEEAVLESVTRRILLFEKEGAN